MEYLIMAYLLGIGFMIGMYAEARTKDTKTEHATPAEALLFLISSPVMAVIWGVFFFFKGKDE